MTALSDAPHGSDVLRRQPETIVGVVDLRGTETERTGQSDTQKRGRTAPVGSSGSVLTLVEGTRLRGGRTALRAELKTAGI